MLERHSTDNEDTNRQNEQAKNSNSLYKLCPICHNNIAYTTSTCCATCAAKKRRKIIVDDYDNLLLRIATSSFAAIAQELDVSSSALQKHLKTLGYPSRIDEIVEYQRQRNAGNPPEQCQFNTTTAISSQDRYKILYDAYQQIHSLRAVARQYQCDPLTVRKACLEYGMQETDFITVSEDQKCHSIYQIDNNTSEPLRFFCDIREAGEWLLNNLSKPPKNLNAAKAGIHAACTGKRHTAYGFKWKLEDKNRG